jgi:site-specific DNA-adenine methylase
MAMKSIEPISVPHPFPYQGSKRGIAKYILPYFPADVRCLIEPFCGAGAVSIAAAAHGLAKRFVLNDLNDPLMALWAEILERPTLLVDEYELLWNEQHEKNSTLHTTPTISSTCSLGLLRVQLGIVQMARSTKVQTIDGLACAQTR